MKVVCRKIINDIGGKDDGLEDGWIKVGNEYIVLTMSYSKHNVSVRSTTSFKQI